MGLVECTQLEGRRLPQPGVNTRTYEYYIDFASRHGIEYIILDEGWYPTGNLLKSVPAIDVPALVAYGKKKNVGIILWVIWKTFDDQFQPALDLISSWGVKGVKVDFMQRDDQPVMRFYYRVCEALAKRKMLVDFHGGIRPALLTRTWPNLISTEGVQGLEHMKWSNASDPEHNLSLPFTRMFLGPMDYTPGAMLNATVKTFRIVFNEPMSLSTRVHQLAMYVVFESPLQMLADSPTHYEHEPDAMEFLGPVPSVWDETRVLDGAIGRFIIVARRHGQEWYLAAMTDWTPRSGATSRFHSSVPARLPDDLLRGRPRGRDARERLPQDDDGGHARDAREDAARARRRLGRAHPPGARREVARRSLSGPAAG